MTRLMSVKEKWIRAWTWQVFTHGMVASQRGENAFRWFKEKQTKRQHLPLSVIVQQAFKMSSERASKSEDKVVKNAKTAAARTDAQGLVRQREAAWASLIPKSRAPGVSRRRGEASD